MPLLESLAKSDDEIDKKTWWKHEKNFHRRQYKDSVIMIKRQYLNGGITLSAFNRAGHHKRKLEEAVRKVRSFS